MINRTAIILPGVLLIALLLSGCKVVIPERPSVNIPDSSNIGPDGPIPFHGWEIVERRGVFDSGDYRDTGGFWYIMLEETTFLIAAATQVYINEDPNNPDRSWELFKKYRISGRFLYIDDISRKLWGTTFVIFIYLNQQ